MSDNKCEEINSLSKLSLTSSQDFPDEIIHDILLRLPIKSLIKFTSVCKSWNSLIKNPTFILTHLKASTFSNTHHAAADLLLLRAVFFGKVYRGGRTAVLEFKQEYSLRYDDSVFGEFSTIEFPVGFQQIAKECCFRVVGVCNGVVSLSDDLSHYAYNFVVWNPCVRKYVILPKPGVRFKSHGGYDTAIGFGYDDVSHAYKVVRVVTLLDQTEDYYDCPTVAEVYSLAKGCWSSVRSDVPPCQLHGFAKQVFVNGVIHWLALRYCDDDHFRYIVLTFDVRAESFGEMELPKNFILREFPELQLSASPERKSLAMFARRQSVDELWHQDVDELLLDIWLMKDYCVEESWTKVTISTPQDSKGRLPEAVCFRKSGELVLNYGDHLKLASVEVVDQPFESVQVAGGQLCYILPYEQSLVLLDNKNAVSY